MRKQNCLHSVRLQSQKRDNDVTGCITSENIWGNQQEKKKKQAFISKTKNVNCMKESIFHNIANAKSILEIAKGKIGAWASHRREDKGGCTLANRGSIPEASCWQH